MPIIHGNDRVEWFFQMCDEITWDCGDKMTAEPRARVVMKAGDMAAMPADCRHQGFSPKRSMLLVWEKWIAAGGPRHFGRQVACLSGVILKPAQANP
ncbi:hypothetical protein ACFS07_33590 [Undibacterium arcticum]